MVAVIRSTGQSLLDYVPEGATRTGYARTSAADVLAEPVVVVTATGIVVVP